MSKLKQMKALKNGNGIQHLLDEAYKILGNPINLFDTDYMLIAYTDVSLDDPYWNELRTTGTFTHESQMFFKNEYFTDEVANAEKIAMMKSDKLKYDRVLGHVFNGHGIKVANILMIEGNQSFDPDALAAFELLADLVTNEIRNDEFYIAYGESYQDSWIKKLIDYDIEEKGLYSPHVQILYNDFKANLYLAAVNVACSKTQQNKHKYFVDLLRQKRKDFKYAVYDPYIVMIMSTNYKTFNIKRDFGDLAEYFEQENIFVGISSRFDNLFELYKYYAEAVQALNGAALHGNPHISLYKKRTP